MEGVDADPFDLEFGVRAEHRLEARDDALRLLLGLGVGGPAELQVDPPQPVRSTVEQGGAALTSGGPRTIN